MWAERSERKEWKSFQIKIITCICRDGEATAAGIFRHFSPSTCWRAVKTEATEEIKTENCQKPTRGNFLTFFFLRSLSLPLAHSSLLTFGVINISFLSKISLVRSLATHKKNCVTVADINHVDACSRSFLLLSSLLSTWWISTFFPLISLKLFNIFKHLRKQGGKAGA